jgi:hypothetical protein
MNLPINELRCSNLKRTRRDRLFLAGEVLAIFEASAVALHG